MKLETFFEKFDQFVDAPDAVSKMRELVLQLAVQGALVDQRPSELSAAKCIADANKALIEFASDKSKVCPMGWVAVPLGCLIVTWTPRTEPVLVRASLPARLGQEKPHETQTPHSRADHPQAAHR